MKRLLVFLMMVLISGILFGNQAKIFERADLKRVSNVPALVTNISIPVKTDIFSLKKFIKNDFYKNFDIGQNVEPELLRAVNFNGTSIYKFALFYKGIPVEGAYTVLTVRNGKIDRITNSMGKIDIDISKLISVDAAVKSAMKTRGIKNTPAKFHAEKLIYPYFNSFVPVFKVRFTPVSLVDNRFHIVEANTGNVIYSGNSVWFQEAPTDKAEMWEFNPLVTPEKSEVDLIWVSSHEDDSIEVPGSLTSEEDGEGVRAIKAFNCPNKSEKISLEELIGYPVEVPMCSPTQLANKIDNGSFIYDDCEEGNEFDEDHILEENINRCAEISMYYHSSKIYNYLRGLYSVLGYEDEFYLQNNDAERPLNVIGNFATPEISMEAIMGGSEKLVPFDNAFFSQDNPMIGDLLGQFGVKGDLLVFGLGTKANLVYDGDVVYHEFGHATIYTTGIVGMEYTDKYGITNEPGSLHEGLADTFAFLMTNDSCTGEYASKGFVDYAASQGGIIEMDKEGDFYCMRSALNEYVVFEDFIGEVHWDGQPLLAANWEILNLLKKDMDDSSAIDNLARLVMTTLYSLGSSDASFKLFAEIMMDEVEKDDVFKSMKDDIYKILEERNFFEEIRARSANKAVKESYVAGVASDSDMTGGGGGAGIEVEEGEETIAVAPSYLQFYYDVPEDSDKTGFRITASVQAGAGGGLMPTDGGTPELAVYYRKGAPIEYSLDEDSMKVQVLKDGKAESEGTGISRKWSVPDVEKGEKYYFQFINTASAGTMKSITVITADVEVDDEEDDGEEVSDDEDDESLDNDVIPEEDVTETKKSSKGCSVLLF